jgi:DNA-binding sugar fermentation-stimulating protein
MAQLEQLLKMAEDELTQYSTDARKIEKLRRKIGLSVSLAEQRQIKAALLDTMQPNQIAQIVEQQRHFGELAAWVCYWEFL